MTTSTEIGELAAALALARKDFATFGKGKTAKIESPKGRYEYKYGDLADLFDATTPALSANGLTLTQWPDVDDDGRFVIVTWLLHKSGQWMRSKYPMATYDRPQEQGSALTYAKRYAAGAALGIAAEVDDDGAAAQQATARPAAPAIPPGYDDWLNDLAAVADEGTAKLQDTWTASKPEFRKFLTASNQTAWANLKALAAKKDKA